MQPVNKPQQATKPYSANWRERRQKARVIAAAYRRGALLTKRRELMEAWAPHNTHADELADRL